MSGFSFFHPHYLWALFFLLIPILIHLIRRRRIIKFDFSSIRFLKDTAVKASRIRWLKNLLLLLNRLLIVIFLILVFAQPFNKKDPFRIISGSNVALYCWIDPTISMGYERDGVSLWREACEMAFVFDTVLHSAAKFYCYDGRVDDFIDMRHAGALEEADNVFEVFTPLRHGRNDFEYMLQIFNENRKKDSRTPVLVLLSDFQGKERDAYRNFFSTSQISFPVICVSLAVKNPWNYSISNSDVSFENNPALKCHIRSQGRRLKSCELAVLIESMRVGQEMVNLKRDDSLTVSIDISHRGEQAGGEARLMVEDPYDFDNTSYFVERRVKSRRVLVISEGDESFPIVAAVRSLSESRWPPLLEKSPMDITYDDLDSSDIIILSGIKDPTSVLSTLWGMSALSNKTILFAPNVDDNAGSLNNIIFKHLKVVSGIQKVQTEKPFFPVLPDTVSALWRGFPRFTDRDVSIYACYSKIPGNVLLRLNKGMPLISHCLDSSGHSWIVFATPIGITEANNLCETGFYIPLLDRIIRYGYQSAVETYGAWIAGKPVNNPFSGSRISAQIFDSDNKRIALWDRQPQVVLETPGIYKVHPHNESAYWIAAVVDTSEGGFRYKKPDVAEVNNKYVRFLDRSSFINFIQHHNSPGYDFIWLLLALCLVFEVLLWKRGRK